MNLSSAQLTTTMARFPGLDGLRTILALLVVCSHIEDCKVYFPAFPRLDWHSYFVRSGYEAVQCFFVLSGFLITCLLLQEREQTGRISIRQFYWKRVLRIWPLYFTITLISFFVVPRLVNMAQYSGTMQSFEPSAWWLYVVILPNLALLFYPLVLGASQLWSIGIEEQFYLFWPWLVRVCKQRLPAVLLACIVSKPLLVAFAADGLEILSRRGYVESPHVMSVLTYAHLICKLFPFETLAWGGLFAWLVHSRNQFWHRVLGHPASQVLSWGALAAWQFASLPPLHEWHYQLPFSGLLYGLAVWNIGANPRTLIGLRANWLNKLGTLTYGMYMWHVLVIVAVFSTVDAWNLHTQSPPWLFQSVLYSSVIGLTLLVAQVSFAWLEMPFLKLKNRWFGQPPSSIPRSAVPGSLSTLSRIAAVPLGEMGNSINDDYKPGTRAA